MRIFLKSIYFRVFSSFLLIIVFSLAVSTAIEYRLYASELPVLFTEIQSIAAAGQISSIYTRNNSWNGMVMEIQRLSNLESLNTDEGAVIRMVVRDADDRTVYNSFSNILNIEDNVLLEGESQPVVNYTDGRAVGSVTLYIGEAYINMHVRDYVSALLKAAVYRGLITAVLAALISLLISRRITDPVISLTSAAVKISEGGSDIETGSVNDDEIGRLSRAFKKMVANLNSQRESRRSLLADISHEINTPLNAIKLEARALSDGLVTAEDAGAQIIDEVDSLRNVIYDLDWLAESDSGSYTLKRVTFDVAEMIRVEADRWQYKAETTNISIEPDIKDVHSLAVFADPVRLGSAISNLIDNAVKYSPPGSRVKISVTENAGNINISVCDEGVPIPEEYRPLLFTRGFRVPSAGVDRRKGGRGLGLAIASEIARMHGGELILECGETSGNCFSLTLPSGRT